MSDERFLLSTFAELIRKCRFLNPDSDRTSLLSANKDSGVLATKGFSHITEGEGQTAAVKGVRAVIYLDMEMDNRAVAGIADRADDIALVNSVADLHRNTVGGEVAVGSIFDAAVREMMAQGDIIAGEGAAEVDLHLSHTCALDSPHRLFPGFVLADRMKCAILDRIGYHRNDLAVGCREDILAIPKTIVGDRVVLSAYSTKVGTEEAQQFVWNSYCGNHMTAMKKGTAGHPTAP